nr:hypothetical protein [uncultured Oscillibacter sp.]
MPGMKVLSIVFRQFICFGFKDDISPAAVVDGKFNAKRNQRGSYTVILSVVFCFNRGIAMRRAF